MATAIQNKEGAPDKLLIERVRGYWASASLRRHVAGEHFSLENAKLPGDLVYVPNVAEAANFATDYRGLVDAPNAEFIDIMEESSNIPTLRLGLRMLPDGPSREGMVFVKYGDKFKPGAGLPSDAVYDPKDKLLAFDLPEEASSTEEVSYWGATELLTYKQYTLAEVQHTNDESQDKIGADSESEELEVQATVESDEETIADDLQKALGQAGVSDRPKRAKKRRATYEASELQAGSEEEQSEETDYAAASSESDEPKKVLIALFTCLHDLATANLYARQKKPKRAKKAPKKAKDGKAKKRKFNKQDAE